MHNSRNDVPDVCDELADFLLARLADDEAAARALLVGHDIAPFESLGQGSDHVARHGPVRVLREVAAKRAMVEIWRDGRGARAAGVPCRGLDVADAMIVALAAVFAGHPAFDLSWLSDQAHQADEAGQREPADNVIPLPGRC